MGDRTHSGASDGDASKVALFQAVATLTPTPVVVTEVRSGRLLFANDAFAELIGEPIEVLLSRSATDFYPAEERRQIIAMLEQHGAVTDREVELRRPDGDLRIVLISARPITIGEGPALVTSLRDITKRKQMESALRDSEERERAVAALTPFPVGITRLSDGALVYVNRAFADFMQATTEELLGQPAPDFYADPAARDRMLAELKENGELYDHEILARLPDGSERLTLVNLQVLAFAGEPSIMASVADITERHGTENALRDERRRLAGILELAGEAIISVGPDDRIALFNRSAEQVFGYTSNEALGQPLGLLIPEDFRAAHRQHVDDFVGAGDAIRRMGVRREVQARHRGGDLFPVSVAISKLELGDQTVLTAVVRDLSEAKAAEAALEQSRAQLRHSQKIQAIGQLAGGVAHDFNNLLTAIFGSCALLSRQLGSNSALHEEIDEIMQAAERAAELTQQLLAFGRKQTMRPTVVDLRSVVKGVRGMLCRLIGESIDLRIETGLVPVLALVDTGQLEQILVNLVINGADALQGGGALTLTTEPRLLEAPLQTPHGTVAAGEWATLAVIDEGSGIDEDTLARIFEPFFTTKAPGIGTGLGLSTVLGIVEQSGGSIEVITALGVGTTMRIYLPLKSARMATEPPPRRHQRPSSDGVGHVLLVEDDHRLRRLCTRILRANGYEVTAAANGREAMATAQELEGAFDILVSDVVMPELNGPDLAERILARWPHVAVLFMTGYAEGVMAVREGRAISPVVHKPFQTEQLCASVREVLDARPVSREA